MIRVRYRVQNLRRWWRLGSFVAFFQEIVVMMSMTVTMMVPVLADVIGCCSCGCGGGLDRVQRHLRRRRQRRRRRRPRSEMRPGRRRVCRRWCYRRRRRSRSYVRMAGRSRALARGQQPV